MLVSILTESIPLRLYFYFYSKQHSNRHDYLHDTITRALHEEPLYKAKIVFLPPAPSHQAYKDLLSAGFHPKQRTKDIWDKDDITKLQQTIQQIATGEIKPQVILFFYFIYSGSIEILHSPLCL